MEISNDELACALVKSAASDIQRAFAYFEGKSATNKIRLIASHTMASVAISHAEAALGLVPGHLTPKPLDGTNKPAA